MAILPFTHLPGSPVQQSPIRSSRRGPSRAGFADARPGAWLSFWITVGLALLLFTGLALRAGSTDGYRFFRTIGVGEKIHADPRLLLPGQVPLSGYGYDGQFYFFIAQDPFLRNPAIASSLDASLRYRRIGMPLLAWALSLGHREFLPLVLILINVLACTATVAACALTALRLRRQPWHALAVAVFPGTWVSLLHDMTEPLQIALAAWGMVATSAGLLFLSSLTKETTVIVQLSEAARNAIGRRWGSAARNALLMAAVGVWALLVRQLIPGRDSGLFAQFLQPPGAPFILLAQEATHPAVLALLVPALAICLLSIARLARIRDRFALGAAGYALVGLAAGSTTWIDPFAYMRTIALAGVLVFLSWLDARDRLGFAVVVLMLFSGALTLAVALLP